MLRDGGLWLRAGESTDQLNLRLAVAYDVWGVVVAGFNSGRSDRVRLSTLFFRMRFIWTFIDARRNGAELE